MWQQRMQLDQNHNSFSINISLEKCAKKICIFNYKSYEKINQFNLINQITTNKLNRTKFLGKIWTWVSFETWISAYHSDHNWNAKCWNHSSVIVLSLFIVKDAESNGNINIIPWLHWLDSEKIELMTQRHRCQINFYIHSLVSHQYCLVNNYNNRFLAVKDKRIFTVSREKSPFEKFRNFFYFSVESAPQIESHWKMFGLSNTPFTSLKFILCSSKVEYTYIWQLIFNFLFFFY